MKLERGFQIDFEMELKFKIKTKQTQCFLDNVIMGGGQNGDCETILWRRFGAGIAESWWLGSPAGGGRAWWPSFVSVSFHFVASYFVSFPLLIVSFRSFVNETERSEMTEMQQQENEQTKRT